MFYKKDNNIYYKGKVVDVITPEIISERMIKAGYDSRLVNFIAYNNGITNRDDAIKLGTVIGKIKPLLTSASLVSMVNITDS